MKRTIRMFTVLTLVFAALTVGFLISYRFSGDRVTLLGAGIPGTLTGTFLFALLICILDYYYFGTKENKNAEDSKTDKSEFSHITAAEAYIQSLPYIEKKVWQYIHSAIEAGRNKTYLSGEDAKIPREIIKELLDKNYRVEVIEFSFREFPSLEVFFNQTSVGGLYLRVDEDGFLEYSYRPLSLEEYDKIAK